jgi:hypothetical protein
MEHNVEALGFINCPCRDCKKLKQWDSMELIRGHLLWWGFMPNYMVWTKHGEESKNPHDEQASVGIWNCNRDTNVGKTGHVNENETVLETINKGVKETIVILGNESLAYNEVVDALDQMIDARKPNFLDEKNQKKLEELRKHAETLLYNGLTVTKLDGDILLLEMKASNGMSDTRFNDVLSLLQKFVPSPNELPQNMYEAKKMICPMELKVQKIHACPNECILFCTDYKDLDSCPRCHASR